jgi:hypothetical protein
MIADARRAAHNHAMATPTIVDIPHNLGREAAKARLRANIGNLGDHIPGGLAALEASWPGPDQMLIVLEAMGQRLTVTLDVADTSVRASFMLPGALGFMADAISAAVRRQGSQLLLPGKS